MKTTPTAIVCAALLGAVASAWAQDGVVKPRVFGNGVMSDHVAVYDIDENGRLSIEELQALESDRTNRSRHAPLRNRWDTNRDGRIDQTERRAAVIEIRRRIEARRSHRFDEVDSNSDGFLTQSEFVTITAVANTDTINPGVAADIFRHLDHDNDDRVSKAEFLRSLNSLRPVPTDGVAAPQPSPHQARSLDRTPVVPAGR